MTKIRGNIKLGSRDRLTVYNRNTKILDAYKLKQSIQ